MANLKFEALNCANKIKAVVSGSLREFETKYSVRCLVEGPDEDGVEEERIVFVGWRKGQPAPEIGCRLMLTSWTNTDTGQEGLAYTPVILDDHWTMPMPKEKTE
ncbi:MAG: hypothetical protein IJV31_07020 [Clostridia bacterium]|nr:hypothetical protein [Clostridia bacterium]